MLTIDSKVLVLAHLANHPGSRLRDINAKVTRGELIGILSELEDRGEVRRELYRDPANMEAYYKWYAVV